jgi:ABC-type dipeptide/oligopeptide/nickel transport system permease subunit
MIDPRAWRRFRQNRGAIAGSLLVLALASFALFGPILSGHDPDAIDFANARDALGALSGPSAAHPLGVDTLFRDLLSRLCHGARLSLGIGLVATSISVAIGAAVGLASGYARGTRANLLDVFCMLLVDVGLSVPYLILVMAIGAALGETSLTTVLLVLGLTSWFGAARIIRSKTIQVRALDFIAASRALGQSSGMLLLRHVLPNVAGPLVVIGSATVAQMILAEAILSYLQVGLPPPTASWGRMLFEGQSVYTLSPRLVIAPGALIFLAVIAFNLVGEGLRDALDPQEE